MINTLYLPEIREMLATRNVEEMREFCQALHPSRIASYMDGLTADEAWEVLRHTDEETRAEIFTYFDQERQVDFFETQDRDELAQLTTTLAADDRVDILNEISDEIEEDLLQRLPARERRNILRLRQYPEGTAGAVMTTEFVALAESLSVREALETLSQATDDFETIYYLYIVDSANHLRGLVSARQLVANIRKQDTLLSELMETDLMVVDAMDHQEDVAEKVASLDVLAIPVLDQDRQLVGIITHDDVIDVVREEALEDAYRISAVDPLDSSYLKTGLLELSWKRGMWLAILFLCALLTAFALERYEGRLAQWAWLVPFIPLVISSGGNTGSQSSTLIITALAHGHITPADWWKITGREAIMGGLLGAGLGLLGLLTTVLGLVSIPDEWGIAGFAVVPLTLFLVVIAGTLTGSLLPLLFQKMGLDPAMMSNPFVAGIVDIVGIVIYMNVAALIWTWVN